MSCLGWQTEEGGGFVGGSLAHKLAAAGAVECRSSSSSLKGATMVSHTPAGAKDMTFDVTSAPSAQGPLAGCLALGGGEGQLLWGGSQAQL